jgi:hypothetical protein
MKKLAHMRLFEAFESEKLSKTLAYIKPEEKKKFMNVLKPICENIDFPESELSDEYFQYLPFSKALQLNFSAEDLPCDARSEDVIERRYAVPGEKCQKGLIKRKWGNGTRMVECPRCHGTGLRRKDNYPIKWVKFWFSKDGNFIYVTGTDGVVRDQTGAAYIVSNSNFSKNIGDYEKTKALSLTRDISNLKTGSLIWINCGGSSRSGVAVIWKSRRGGTYVIQDFVSGGSDSNSNEWQKFGRYSYSIGGGGDRRGPAYLIEPKGAKTEDDKIDPYTWNAPLDFHYMNLSNSPDVKNRLGDAHFALVLNYLDLQNSKFTPKTEIKGKRSTSKSGAYALRKPEDIKQENIQRYLDTLAKNIKLDTNLQNVDKNIIRLLGWNLSGIYLLRNRATGKLENLVNNIYNLIKADESDKRYYVEAIVDIFRSTTDNNRVFNDQAQRSIKAISDWCKGHKDDPKVEMWNKFMDLQQKISQKLKTFKVSTLEEMEVFYMKYRNLKDLARGNSRYQYLAHFIVNVADRFEDTNRTLFGFKNIESYHIDHIIRDIDNFSKIIDHI